MTLISKITEVGNSIIALTNTRAKTDLSNITAAGEAVIASNAANKDLGNITSTGENKIRTIAGASSSAPVGTVIAYMGTDTPTGYLLMDGRELSKTTYAALYAVVGDSMGTASTSGYFKIADMTDGRYLMGSTVAGGRMCARKLRGAAA